MALSWYGWLIAIVFHVYGTNTDVQHHPFYVSVTEINHNAKEKTIEISCKIFADDLESVLTKISGTKVNVGDSKTKTDNSKLISAYVMKHLQLKIDGKPVNLQFVGFEKEEDVIWSYYRVNDVPMIKTLEITDTILYDMYESETNLVHVLVNGNRQSKKVTNPEKVMVFNYN